jgi:hypothetical protein
MSTCCGVFAVPLLDLPGFCLGAAAPKPLEQYTTGVVLLNVWTACLCVQCMLFRPGFGRCCDTNGTADTTKQISDENHAQKHPGARSSRSMCRSCSFLVCHVPEPALLNFCQFCRHVADHCSGTHTRILKTYPQCFVGCHYFSTHVCCTSHSLLCTCSPNATSHIRESKTTQVPPICSVHCCCVGGKAQPAQQQQ